MALSKGETKKYFGEETVIEVQANFKNPTKKVVSYPETSHSRKPLLPWGLKG